MGLNIKQYTVDLLNMSSVCNIRIFQIKSNKLYYYYFSPEKSDIYKDVELVLDSKPINKYGEYKTISIRRSYQNFCNYFLYDIPINKYQSLNSNSRLKLIDLLSRSSDVIDHLDLDLIQLEDETICSKQAKISDQSVKEYFNLTDTELEYIRKIAIYGSAKKIGFAFDMSHRTVELMIKRISKKFGIYDKVSTQIFARMLSTVISNEIQILEPEEV